MGGGPHLLARCSPQMTLERELEVETYFLRKEMQMLVQRTIYCELNSKSVSEGRTECLSTVVIRVIFNL